MKYECPEYEFDCPYLKKDGECVIGNPLEECDTYMFHHGDELEEKE